jgi:hypothetical protein
MSNRGSSEGHIGHICVVMRATHDMPDRVYFLCSKFFLPLEIVYHISKCKNILNKEKHPVFLTMTRLSSLNYKNCNFGR